MECDSVHSTTERSLKHQNVYAPSDYYVFVRSTRRQDTPYRVHVMATEHFKDYKTAAKTLVRNKNKANTETISAGFTLSGFGMIQMKMAQSYSSMTTTTSFAACQPQLWVVVGNGVACFQKQF